MDLARDTSVRRSGMAAAAGLPLPRVVLVREQTRMVPSEPLSSPGTDSGQWRCTPPVGLLLAGRVCNRRSS